MRKFVALLFIHIILYSCSTRDGIPPKAAGPIPSPEQQTWHEMEMNAFIHFTTNTFTDKEWGFGDESPSVFNPSDMHVEQWISTLKEAGFKGVILTAKHHDGFCLWSSKYTEHSVKNSPYKGDVVKEVSEACEKYGLKFGIYLSPWDRNHADYGSEAYITYYRNQLEELFSSYGPIFEMWFDGANGGDGYYGGKREVRKIDGTHYYDWPGTLAMVRSMEPSIIFFSDAGPGVRWVGNERGIAGETNWNTITPDTLYAGKAGIESLLNSGNENGTHWIPAEVDVSIRPGWFYHQQEDSFVKTPEQLFEIYMTSVGRGSTLLLNVPPDTRGMLHEKDVASLKGFRALLDKEFNDNLMKEATLSASHTRSKNQFTVEMLTDGNKDTYWATDDGVTSATIECTFKSPQQIKYVMLQEYIPLGQRVRSFAIDAWIDNEWKEVGSATTIGYKRIIRVTPILTDKIRISFKDAKECLVISNAEIY